MQKIKNPSAEIKKVLEIMNTMTVGSKEWEAYDSVYRGMVAHNLDITAAMERGFEEGEKRGERCGERRGDHRAREETAKKMLEKELPIEDIIEITGLGKEEIENLKVKA